MLATSNRLNGHRSSIHFLDRRGGFLCCFRVAVVIDNKIGALFRQAERDCLSDALATSGNKRFLGAYKDKAGQWFDGAKTYKLHVAANPPAKQFWSLTIYDTRTRCLIDNPQGVADKSSRMPDLVKNAEGSVDLYMSPNAPAGYEQNWIPTVPGRAWFTYFRFYGPLEAYFDQSLPLPDIERVK